MKTLNGWRSPDFGLAQMKPNRTGKQVSPYVDASSVDQDGNATSATDGGLTQTSRTNQVHLDRADDDRTLRC